MRRRNSASAAAPASPCRMSAWAAFARHAPSTSSKRRFDGRGPPVPIGRSRALLFLQNKTQKSQTGSSPDLRQEWRLFMAFLVYALSGLALVGFGVARLKARRSQKRDVQTLFGVAK